MAIFCSRMAFVTVGCMTWARLSAHQGQTWGASSVLVDFEDATDGGYPSNVQLDDGTIVTAYDANRVKAHHRYHVGVVRWRAD